MSDAGSVPVESIILNSWLDSQQPALKSSSSKASQDRQIGFLLDNFQFVIYSSTALADASHDIMECNDDKL
jgi:hypothetical protein